MMARFLLIGPPLTKLSGSKQDNAACFNMGGSNFEGINVWIYYCSFSHSSAMWVDLKCKSNNNLMGNFSFLCFSSLAFFILKIFFFFKTFFQEHYQSVKQSAKVISRTEQNRTEIYYELDIYTVFHYTIIQIFAKM